ncbi:MAG: FeoC-like transcriptional regulator [Spirochaetota bacterium]
MKLRTVAATLEELGAATVSQLAAELNVTRHELEPALAFWEHRGDIRRCRRMGAAACGTSCTKCPIGQGQTNVPRAARPRAAVDTVVVYEWIGGRRPAPRAGARGASAGQPSA